MTVGQVALVVLLVAASPLLGEARGISPVVTEWVWTDWSTPAAPPAAAGTLLAYDPVADRFVFFGGWNGTTLNETWAFDPTNHSWTNLHPANSPVSRADATFVYDPSQNQFLLFGGWTELANGTVVRLNDTWSFSLSDNQWTERKTTDAPSPRSDSANAFDPNSGELFLFGGFTGSEYLGDDWEFDPTTNVWTPLTPSGPSPGPRSDGRMVFDAATNAFVLFGGNNFSGPNLTFHHLADTWAYHPASDAWTELEPTLSPPARDYAVEGFVPQTEDILLFGGFGNRTILGDTWSLSPANNTWTSLSPPDSPPGRYAGGGGYDTDDRLFLIVGGLGATGLLNDTWSLESQNVTAGPMGVPWGVVWAAAAAAALFAGLSMRVAFVKRGSRIG